jgi:hypothetical protein
LLVREGVGTVVQHDESRARDGEAFFAVPPFLTGGYLFVDSGDVRKEPERYVRVNGRLEFKDADEFVTDSGW